MSEVSAKFDRPHVRDWRSFLVMREFFDPLATRAFNTMLNVIWETNWLNSGQIGSRRME